MKNQYPLMIDLTDQPCLVVGAGDVATRKIESLLAAGAHVTVISPHASERVRKWAEDGRLVWRKEEFVDQDVSPFVLTVAGTDNPAVNLAVYEAVKASHGWINIVDRPDLCNFIVPSVVQRGKLVIAVSTSGASPGLARRIKGKIEQMIGQEYEGYVDFLADMRRRVLEEIPEPHVRRQIFQRLLDESYVEADEQQRMEMAERLLTDARESGET